MLSHEVRHVSKATGFDVLECLDVLVIQFGQSLQVLREADLWRTILLEPDSSQGVSDDLALRCHMLWVLDGPCQQRDENTV